MPTNQERIDELVECTKHCLTNENEEVDSVVCGSISSIVADFCRMKNYNFPSDQDCFNNFAVPFHSDYKLGVFHINDVNEALIDDRIPAEWK